MIRLSVTDLYFFIPCFNHKQVIESVSGHCNTLSGSQDLTSQEVQIDGQNANLALVSLTV